MSHRLRNKIRGQRKKDLTIDEENYFYQECYWGNFSRSIILPVDVKTDKINANIYLNGGAFLEWISGAQRQAPKWVTKCYLEWFYRLIKDPIRLWKRYILGNPLFIYRIIREKIGLL